MIVPFDKAGISEKNGALWLCLRVTDEQAARKAVYEIKDGANMDADLRPHREKRSLDANAYCWVLLDKLSAKLAIPPTDIYRDLIKDVGGASDFVCVQKSKAANIAKWWCAKGIGWQFDLIGDSKAVKGCSVLKLYYGSSTYDTAQMSRLIDLVVQECQQQGIETMAPSELDALKARWNDVCK